MIDIHNKEFLLKQAHIAKVQLIKVAKGDDLKLASAANKVLKDRKLFVRFVEKQIIKKQKKYKHENNIFNVFLNWIKVKR